MPTNTAGTLSIVIRSGIGLGGMRLMVSVVTSVPTFIVTFRLEVAPAFMNRTRVNVMTTANLDNIALTVLDSVAVCL